MKKALILNELRIKNLENVEIIAGGRLGFNNKKKIY